MQRREMPGNKADGAKMAWSCEGLVPEGNLVIVERCEDKADAQQATRLKARMLAHPSGSASPNLPSASLRRISRHFPQISKHPRRHCGVGEEVKYIVPKINIEQIYQY